MNKTGVSKTFFSRPRLAAASVLGIAAVTIAVVAVKTNAPVRSTPTPGFAFKRGVPRLMPGGNKKALFGSTEFRYADYSPAVEAYLKRAYPAAEVPWEATLAARDGWDSLSRKPHSAGTWQLIGPSEADVPGVLNALGDTAPYITAGRVTALALSPKCGSSDDDGRDDGTCRLYVAAAGGGIWRTDEPLHTNPSQKWVYVSASFGTNFLRST